MAPKHKSYLNFTVKMCIYSKKNQQPLTIGSSIICAFRHPLWVWNVSPRVTGDYCTGFSCFINKMRHRGLFFEFQIRVLGINQVLHKEQVTKISRHHLGGCSDQRGQYGLGRVTSDPNLQIPPSQTPRHTLCAFLI